MKAPEVVYQRRLLLPVRLGHQLLQRPADRLQRVCRPLASNLLGPYVDREGVSLLPGASAAHRCISMNGNRWVGTGHNAVFKDFDGQ